MRAFTISSALLSVFTLASAQSSSIPVTGKLGNAMVSTGNPAGEVYLAILPENAFSYPGPQGNVRGFIKATAGPDGVGVQFEANFFNLPKTGGPFMYHLHVAPVPEDGNCTKTLAHLDPTERGEATPCDATHPETCQTGDLSGKHGNLTTDPFVHTYVDLFASTLPGVGAFFGNRSVVVHFGNKTRITCANFVLQNSANGTITTNGTGNPIQYIPGSGASTLVSSTALLVLAGLIAFLM